MKFRNIKTIDHILKEYGMTSGGPTYNQGGTAQKKLKSPTTAKNKVSPTTGIKPAQAAQPAQPFVPAKAGEIGQGDTYYDDKGTELGVVKTPIGDGPKPDAVVVQDPKTKKYSVVDADDELNVSNPEYAQESSRKIGKLLSKNKKKHHLHRKIKRLVRSNKLKEQGTEELFEINFNSKTLAREALDYPIKCGFEAETSWESISGGSENDDWLDETSWYNLEDIIYEQEGGSSVQRIESEYEEFIDNDALERSGDCLIEIRNERKEDEIYINDYIDMELDEDDIEDYKQQQIDDMSDDQLEEYEDWDLMAWGRQYVEEELEDDFIEWLDESIRDSGEDMERAYDEARDYNSMDEWASSEYGSWSECLTSNDIYLTDPDGEGGGIDEVGDLVSDWATDNSKISGRVDVGDYHSGYGTTENWRVETDSSIDSYGTGAEIISPVYDTPKEMLTEMKSLFDWMKGKADTNRSTGLHVTMSYNPEQTGASASADVNAVKLAVMLGDKYLLSTFNRLGNSYAKSQMRNLEKLGMKLKADPNNTRTISSIEEILAKGIDTNKFSAINFKDEKDKETGYKLIEFRIGGGDDYHLAFDKVLKAVVRYSATLSSAYSDDLYKDDYAKALFRLINRAGQIDPDDEEGWKFSKGAKLALEHPCVNVLKNYFSKESYMRSMSRLASAFESMREYHDEGDVKLEDARTKQMSLKQAQESFATAILQAGYDLNQNLNRAPVNAKAIGVLRNTLPEFELNYDKLSTLVDKVWPRVETYGGKQKPVLILSRIKNGVDRLFKKDVVKEPAFLNATQYDRAVTGMWNMINSDDFYKKSRLDINANSKEVKQFISVLGDATKGHNEEAIGDIERFILDIDAYREFKVFSNRVERSGMLKTGSPINLKAFNKFLAYLRKFPTWDHPVIRSHDPALTMDDGYEDNAISKMMMRMRLRWEHLEDIREENPGAYIDSMREISKAVEKLVSQNKLGKSAVDEGYLKDAFPELEGTVHANNTDGDNYFAITEYSEEVLLQLCKEIESPALDPFDSLSHKFRDRLQNYFSTVFLKYYGTKAKDPEFYKNKIIASIVQPRIKAIKDFFESFDKVSQQLGFDSQQSDIDKKLSLDKKQQKFNSKHGSKYLNTIDGFSFGGDIWMGKYMADRIDSMTTRTLHDYTSFTDHNRFRSNGSNILKIPHAYYFSALEATKIMQKDPADVAQWRRRIAVSMLAKFKNIYNINVTELDDGYMKVNADTDIKTQLKKLRINFSTDMGDGRVGPDYDPLIPNADTNGPFGEPFSPSAASVWKINNPELAKKAEAEEKIQKAQFMKSKHTDLLAQAAKVSHLGGNSSNGVAQETNWRSLADSLGLKYGDEGAKLLKRTYYDYDGNHNWRPEETDDEGANVIGIQRWGAAVRASLDHIQKNYEEGEFGYTFKDDQDSDYVDGSTTRELKRAAQSYPSFNNIVDNGTALYLTADAERRLIAFLNDATLNPMDKLHLLNAIVRNKEEGGKPLTFDAAKSLITPANESVFAKFTKLPLQEQLNIVGKIDADALARVYEGTVIKNKFATKQAQKGKDKYRKTDIEIPTRDGKPYDRFDYKETESGSVAHIIGIVGNKGYKISTAPLQLAKTLVDMYNRGGFTDTDIQQLDPSDVFNESVPNNDKIYKLTKLLKQPILASDLKAQMEVYFVLPVPSMILDFKMARAQNGNDADLRTIVRGYMNRLHSKDEKKVNNALKENKHLREYDDLESEKENIIKTISGLDANNEQHAQLLDRVYKLLNSEHIGNTMNTAFQAGVADELMPDKEKAKVIQDMTRIVGGLDSDYGTMNQFLSRLESTGTIVNLKELAQPMNSFQSVFGDDTAINAFIALANYGVGKKQKGPGEYALACLSNQIRLAEGEGDLEIEGIGKVELKAALSSSGGRIGYGGGSQKAKRAVLDKYADSIPTVMQTLGGNAGGSLGLPAFMKSLSVDLPTTNIKNQQLRKAIATELLVMDLENFAGPVVDAMATSDDLTFIEDTYLAQNLRWYQNRDHFDALLLMHIPNRKTAMIRTPEDLIAFRRSGHANSTSISIIPTQAGAGREQWAQLTLNKGTI